MVAFGAGTAGSSADAGLLRDINDRIDALLESDVAAAREWRAHGRCLNHLGRLHRVAARQEFRMAEAGSSRDRQPSEPRTISRLIAS